MARQKGKMNNELSPNPLWTKDFTIITIGSVVSMLGSALSGFAMSLLVLDYTKSTFMFALYNVIYMLPNAVVPVLCGPFLDRFSRKRTIYTLDFISSALYLILAAILMLDLFSFPILAVGCFLLGTISSIYYVAYDSFYPLLITEGNYSKAYSIASTLETLAMIMIPISALVYNSVGIVPLFLFNTCTYFIAAVMETHIGAEEKYIEKQKQSSSEVSGGIRRFVSDFRKGMEYLYSEKGLLAIAIYFVFSSFAGGATGSLTLPYFKSTFHNGEYVYMMVWGMMAVGRGIGGFIHYKVHLPVQRKFVIALFVYITLSLLEGSSLYFPVWVMMIMCFCVGILGVTSYNIRISATQHYVPDERKGRFNGTFGTLNTLGTLCGQLIAGALAEFLPVRAIISSAMFINLLAAIFVIGFGAKHVKKIYNVQN